MTARAAREHTHDLLDELRTLYSQLARRAGMPESTLTMTQKLALMELVRMEPLRLGELADHIGVSDPTASRAVEALVVAGLVERIPDPADRRAVLLAVTERGRDDVAQRRAASEAHVAEALDGLSEDDARTLVDVLRRFNEQLERTRGGARPPAVLLEG
jgi:DNA-binding MarR family transcriptional regulator